MVIMNVGELSMVNVTLESNQILMFWPTLIRQAHATYAQTFANALTDTHLHIYSTHDNSCVYLRLRRLIDEGNDFLHELFRLFRVDPVTRSLCTTVRDKSVCVCVCKERKEKNLIHPVLIRWTLNNHDILLKFKTSLSPFKATGLPEYVWRLSWDRVGEWWACRRRWCKRSSIHPKTASVLRVEKEWRALLARVQRRGAWFYCQNRRVTFTGVVGMR